MKKREKLERKAHEYRKTIRAKEKKE